MRVMTIAKNGYLLNVAEGFLIVFVYLKIELDMELYSTSGSSTLSIIIIQLWLLL